jgi:hypothetical protein
MASTPSWKIQWTEAEIKDYQQGKYAFVRQQLLDPEVKQTHDAVIAKHGAESSEAEDLQKQKIRRLEDESEKVLKGIDEGVLKACQAMEKGTMMNGGQPIGFKSVRAWLDCKRDETQLANVRDWEETEHVEQLARAIGFAPDKSGFWHATSPGAGMGFLQVLPEREKYILCLANMFDIHWAKAGKYMVPNVTKSVLTWKMARVILSVGCRVIEIEETAAVNAEFAEILAYLGDNGIRFWLDDWDEPSHPIRELLDDERIRPHILGAKISLKAVSDAQKEMLTNGGHVPRKWKDLCTDIASHFSQCIVEGSDTMLLQKGPPKMDRDSLLLNYDLKRCLAEELHSVHGDAARLGGQSFRQLEPNEEVISAYIPKGFTAAREKWGEAAVPLPSVASVIGLSRHAACGVRIVRS